MEKVLAIGATTVRLQAAPPQPSAPEFASGPNSVDKALACAVLFVEVFDYASRSVAEQLLCKQRLNGHLACALEGVPAAQRIVLDTGAGVAISFLEQPWAALGVLRTLLANVAHGDAGSSLPLHGALNLGPVRVSAQGNGHFNLLGDGINVAQRLLAFAKPDQILVAKTYVEAVLAQDVALASLFSYQGLRTDAHVRDHEVFELDLAGLAQARAPEAAPPAQEPPRPTQPIARTRSRALPLAFAGLSLVALGAMLALFLEREPYLAVSQSTPAKPVLSIAQTPLREVSRAEPVASRAVESSAQPSAETTDTAKAAPDLAPDIPEPSVQPQQAPRTSKAAAAATASISADPPRTPKAHDGRKAQAATMQQSANAPAAKDEPQRQPAPPQPWHSVESAPAAAAQPGLGAPVRAPTALVTLAISPWGEVFVDGRAMGVSPPLRELELPVGKHRVVVRNADFKAFEQELDLSSNQTVRVRHKFAQRS